MKTANPKARCRIKSFIVKIQDKPPGYKCGVPYLGEDWVEFHYYECVGFVDAERVKYERVAA